MRKYIRYPVILLVAGLLAFSAVGAPVLSSPATASLLVSFQQPPGPDEEELIRSLGGVVRHTYEVVPALAAIMPEHSLGRLRADPRVTSVEQDSTARASGEVAHGGLVQMYAGLARPQSSGGMVKVAILDSGIDLDHPDLTVAGDVTFVDGTTSGDDDNGHGTMVAGVVVGVAPEAELYAVKVMDQYGRVYWSDALKGVDWAWKNNMQVVNMSFGSPNAPPVAMAQAIERAYRKGVVLVAGAGNRGHLGLEDSVYYPAKYDEVIAVGATDSTDTRVNTSSTGPALELVAPGGSTSLSGPHVAGTAALVIASGITDNAEVRQRLQETAHDLGDPGRDEEYGYGLVDTYRAVAP